MSFRKTLRKNKVIQFFASVKLTTACLLLFFILIFWGTVAQVENGLYVSQMKYFHSFYFLAAGFIPFPGGQLVMWVLLFNLLAVALVRLVYKWRHIGIITIHFGLLLFLFSGYVTLQCSTESYLPLKESQAKNTSQAYHQWELAVWPADDDSARKVVAVDERIIRKGSEVRFDQFGFSVKAQKYYRNADAFTGPKDEQKFLNATGILSLQEKDYVKELEENNPGGIFTFSGQSGAEAEVLLFGAEDNPTRFTLGDKQYSTILRLKRYPLPIVVKLIDFVKEEHPGTDTPRAFKSLVAIYANGAWREKTISMNNPLRYKDYTFYQSSYQIDKRGNETSILAVVKNAGRLLPYIATFVTFGGLVIHFSMMAFNSRKRKESPYLPNE